MFVRCLPLVTLTISIGQFIADRRSCPDNFDSGRNEQGAAVFLGKRVALPGRCLRPFTMRTPSVRAGMSPLYGSYSLKMESAKSCITLGEGQELPDGVRGGRLRDQVVDRATRFVVVLFHIVISPLAAAEFFDDRAAVFLELRSGSFRSGSRICPQRLFCIMT